MRLGYTSDHRNDQDGNPAGGCTFGTGFTISWQNGPLGRHADECLEMEPPHDCAEGCTRRDPNGAFVEDVIDACMDRLAYYQNSRFACRENQDAMDHLLAALDALDDRTSRREKRGVEGTHAE